MTDWKKYKSLYHYTNFNAFGGIIEKKEIWLSNVRSMNDRKEMMHFMDALRIVILKDLKGREQEINELFDSQIKRLEDEQAYSFSLSTLKDDSNCPLR